MSPCNFIIPSVKKFLKSYQILSQDKINNINSTAYVIFKVGIHVAITEVKLFY